MRNGVAQKPDLRLKSIGRWPLLRQENRVNKIPISVYIITQNEEHRIACAIGSVVSWADEVIVVDSGSTDKTVEVALAAGAKVLHRDWTGYGPQKRFAENQCANNWVLNLDADEEVTPALASEMQQAVDSAPERQAAFLVRITDVLPEEETPAWFAYSYKVLRLYNREFGQMSTHEYQDRVELKSGLTSGLQGRILHRSFVSWEETIRKFNFYTTQVASARVSASKLPSTLRLWLEFPASFLKVWLLRRMIFRGTMGMAMSVSVAYLNLLRLLKTREAASASAESVEQAERIAA